VVEAIVSSTNKNNAKVEIPECLRSRHDSAMGISRVKRHLDMLSRYRRSHALESLLIWVSD
jgi:hypothetical protein